MDKDDLIEEIKELDNIINEGTNNAVKQEWRSACENLNGIKDAKKYWSRFSMLVGSFKTKLYADIKYDDKTATTDQERANAFASHMKNTCKTPDGKEFDDAHREAVEDHINSNKVCF